MSKIKIKPLHEKKVREFINELRGEFRVNGKKNAGAWDMATHIDRKLREWAISLIKNCKNPWSEMMVNMFGKSNKFMCGYYHKWDKRRVYCMACERIINIFEITEKDLK